MESLKQSINQMTEMFNARMAEFQNELQSNCHSAQSPTAKLTSEFDNFKTFVLSALKSLQSQIEVLMELHDQNEMKSRKKILLVHGVPEEKKELLQTVSALITSQLKLPDVDASSVKYCLRLGHLKDIVVRNKIWKAKTNLKSSGITLSGFLTKRRHDVFLMARKRFGLGKCWTQEGSVMVIGPDGSRNRVSSMKDLDAIGSPIAEDEHPVAAVSPAPLPKGKNPPSTRSKKLVRVNK